MSIIREEDYVERLKNSEEGELIEWLTEVELVLRELSRTNQCLHTIDRIGQITVPAIIRTRASLYYLNNHYLERLSKLREQFDNLGVED